MSELVVMPVRSTRTLVEQYLGEHLADPALEAASEAPIPLPIAAERAPAPVAAPDPAEMLIFRVGPLRFALAHGAVGAAERAVEVDVVHLVPPAYAALAAAGRGSATITLACGVALTGVHCEGVAHLAPAAIRWRPDRCTEPWIAGTTAQPARFVLDAPALARAFIRHDADVSEDR